MLHHAPRRVHLLLLALAWSAVLSSSCSPLVAQTPASPALPPAWQIAAGNKQTFDVASVRLSPSGSRVRGPIQNPFDDIPPKAGIFSANGPLIAYIAFAYKLRDLSQMMTLNEKMPAWAQGNNFFDIQARADGAPTQDQIRLMMQSLLAERFKLAVHYEAKTLPVFAVVLDKPGKTGPQLVPHPTDQTCLDKPEKPAPVPPNTAPPTYCGMDGWQVNGVLHIRMIDVTMEQATGLLGGAGSMLGDLGQRSAIDQTGLTGHYDLTIEFVMQKAGDPSADSSNSNDASGPSLTTALKEQLGLKLIKQTGTVNVFVLDHIEKPSEN
jgi:uncharacterized protein (TIGR03435 family)